jgi:hypothetical protein
VSPLNVVVAGRVASGVVDGGWAVGEGVWALAAAAIVKQAIAPATQSRTER